MCLHARSLERHGIACCLNTLRPITYSYDSGRRFVFFFSGSRRCVSLRVGLFLTSDIVLKKHMSRAGSESLSGSEDSSDSSESGLACESDRSESQAAAVEKIQARLRRFFLAHPCPRQSMVTDCVEKIFRTTNVNETDFRLRGILEECQCSIEDFHYESFQRMWEAGGQEAEKEILRDVGEVLNNQGGIASMRLHYYLLSFAVRGPYFIPGDKRSVVIGYARDIECFWHGIGSWQM